MQFVETPVFTKQARELLADEDLRALQLALWFRPEQGAVIPGGDGLRKIRWAREGEGKRGGVRVIYFLDVEEHRVYLLFCYPKSMQDELSRDQLRILARLVREELK